MTEPDSEATEAEFDSVAAWLFSGARGQGSTVTVEVTRLA